MVALHQQIGKQNVYKTGKMLIAGKGMRKSITTLYRGVMPKIHRDGPFGVGLLVGYSRLKETFQSYTNDDRIAIVGAGAVSGGGVAAATHPFDRVSTFLQVDYKKERAKTMWDAFKIIYAEEGWRGFYKGISARVPRAAFAVPIIFTAQEEYRKILHKK